MVAATLTFRKERFLAPLILDWSSSTVMETRGELTLMESTRCIILRYGGREGGRETVIRGRH